MYVIDMFYDSVLHCNRSLLQWHGWLCRQLEEVEATLLNDGASSHHCFTKVENFDTDIMTCLSDPKKALSYQTG